MATDPTTNITASTVFQGMAGGAVGVGIMILLLAKWGAKLFGIKGETGEKGEDAVCPYAADHPKLAQFMGESLQDRRDLREILKDMNGEVSKVGANVSEMKGQLGLLLRGARIRWNGAIKEDEKG